MGVWLMGQFCAVEKVLIDGAILLLQESFSVIVEEERVAGR